MKRPPPERSGGVLEQLSRIREEATDDSISSDLDRARLLVAMASEEERPAARRLYRELCQLERWLHDR